MIWLSFGRWSGAAGRWFVQERVYLYRWAFKLLGKPYIWTPLVRVQRRCLKRV